MNAFSWLPYLKKKMIPLNFLIYLKILIGTPVHEVGVDEVSAVLVLFIVRRLRGEDDAGVVVAGDVRVSVLQDVGRHSGVIKRPRRIAIPDLLIFCL